MSDTGQDRAAAYGQGLPPADGWKRDMPEEPGEHIHGPFAGPYSGCPACEAEAVAGAIAAGEQMDDEAESAAAAPRCEFVTAAGIRCRRDEGHAGAHDTLYIFDALPERPEPIRDPLPEELERLLRDPRISLPGDVQVHALIVSDLERHPETETVPRGSYLSLWALYEKEVRRGYE